MTPSKRSRLIALVERCEQVTGPSRELDEEIAKASGWCWCWRDGYWQPPNDGPRWYGGDPPEWSESVDAALTIKSDVSYEISGPRKYLNIPTVVPNRWHVKVWSGPEFHAKEYDAWGATLALALCAAALRALAAQEKDDG